MAISPAIFIGLICLVGGGSLFPVAEALWLTVPDLGERCFSEDIQTNVVVVADSFYIDQDYIEIGPKLDVRVTSPYGKELYRQANVSHGQFAFTTYEGGIHVACLSMHHDQTHHTVLIGRWVSKPKTGMLLLRRKISRSTEFAAAVKVNIASLKSREENMRLMSEKTNKKVAQLSFVSLGVSFVVSLIQVWYLKRFFLNKKLL